MEQFKCIKCGAVKPRTAEFFYRKSNNRGLQSACKICHCFQGAVNRSRKNRDEVNAKSRAYVAAHKDQEYASHARWRARNREELRLRQKRKRLLKAMNK